MASYDNETSNNTNGFDQSNDELIPSRQVQFWTILAFQIPSLSCTIFLLGHLSFDKRLRQALHNHIIIILLVLCFIIEVIDNSLYLDAYLHHGSNSFHSSPAICLIWWFVEYGVYGAVTVFLTWASFERHILIFYHNRLLGTRLKRIIFHYIPLGFISIYLTGFYIGVILFPPCENIFDYELEGCGLSPCYEEISWLNIWDYLFNGVLCTLIEAICSIYLLIRVIWQRHRAHQRILWRQHRKMTIQLLSISTLVLSTTLPQSLITSIQVMVPGMTDFASYVASYFYFLTSFVVLLLPIVTLGCFPELWPKLIPFKRRRRQIVAPLTITAVKGPSIMMHRRTTFK
jgi:hypothetical protein